MVEVVTEVDVKQAVRKMALGVGGNKWSKRRSGG